MEMKMSRAWRAGSTVAIIATGCWLAAPAALGQSTIGHLRACGTITERRGSNEVQISERRVSCPAAKRLYGTWKERLATGEVLARGARRSSLRPVRGSIQVAGLYLPVRRRGARR